MLESVQKLLADLSLDARVLVGLVGVAWIGGGLVSAVVNWLLVAVARLHINEKIADLKSELERASEGDARTGIARDIKTLEDAKTVKLFSLQPAVTGLVERTLTALLVAIWAPGFGVALVAWLGAKLATGWNTVSGDAVYFRRYAALSSGVVSVCIGVLAGLVIRAFSIP